MWWYNLGIHLYTGAVKAAGLFNRKARLWATGRRGIFGRLREAIPAGERVIWVHSSSLGEFEQGRPVIEALRREHPEYRILLTFFSPSGYEIRKNYAGVDWVFYLPADTRRNVRKFLDIVHPQIAIFIKYEFWLNYLTELERRRVRTYVISAIFRPDSIFFRPYGKAFRKALCGFEGIFVQDSASKDLLEEIGLRNVQVAGDTRFDRVFAIAQAAPELPVVSKFAGDGKIFVAGSTWPADEELLLSLIDANPAQKFIIAPHEPDRDHIMKFAARVGGGVVLYTEATEDTDFSSAQVLVIDTIGILSAIYRYASYGYIGGGFGAGIHNTLEAVTFGVPIAFGPNYRKFREAADLISLGVARSISNAVELAQWWTQMQGDQAAYDTLRGKAREYVASHKGATETIMKGIFPVDAKHNG